VRKGSLDGIASINDDRGAVCKRVVINTAVVRENGDAVNGRKTAAVEWLGCQFVSARPCSGIQHGNVRIGVGQTCAR
jgi:hypothetical protein